MIHIRDKSKAYKTENQVNVLLKELWTMIESPQGTGTELLEDKAHRVEELGAKDYATRLLRPLNLDFLPCDATRGSLAVNKRAEVGSEQLGDGTSKVPSWVDSDHEGSQLLKTYRDLMAQTVRNEAWPNDVISAACHLTEWLNRVRLRVAVNEGGTLRLAGIDILKKSIMMAIITGLQPRIPSLLDAWAAALFKLAQEDQAIEVYYKSLNLKIAMGSSRKDVCETLHRLGSVYLAIWDDDVSVGKAVNVLQEAVTLAKEEVLGNEKSTSNSITSNDLSRYMSSLAEAYGRMGKPKTARDLGLEAWKLSDEYREALKEEEAEEAEEAKSRS